MFPCTGVGEWAAKINKQAAQALQQLLGGAKDCVGIKAVEIEGQEGPEGPVLQAVTMLFPCGVALVSKSCTPHTFQADFCHLSASSGCLGFVVCKFRARFVVPVVGVYVAGNESSTSWQLLFETLFSALPSLCKKSTAVVADRFNGLSS